jgi:curli biogenesis system outer membrane secretion channel CsgG
MWRTRTIYLLTFAFCFASHISAQESKPKVAIKTFENPANFSRSTIGNGLTDILTTELQNTGKFNVLERTNVDELTKEMDFANTEYAKSSTFAKKGNLLGAQYVLMGKVTNFSYAEHAENRQKINLLGPNTIERIYQQRADVRVDFRLIDVATGETIISQPGEAHKTNTSLVSEMETWYRFTSSGSITAEASSSLIGKATTEAVKDIVRKLNALSETVRTRGAGAALNASLENLSNAKGQVVAEEGGGLWILGGVGSANGLIKGDRLKLTHENVVKDKAGKVVYKKSVDIGAMEITDVSQPDHAEARFISNPAGGNANPAANDLVSVDMDYARTLRGGDKTAAASNSLPSAGSTAPTSSAAGNAQLEQLLKRADSYISDKFWSQALDEYKQAAAISPSEPRVLQGEAVSHYMMGDFLEGDESAQKLLQAGEALTVAVAHYHNMGTCTGQLSIQRGKLAFLSDKSDGFDIGPAGLEGVEVHRISKPLMANEKAPDWPVLEVKWHDAGGHEKKYQMIPYMYSKQQSLGGKNFASAFPMDDSDVREMQKLEQSMLTMIQKYVK